HCRRAGLQLVGDFGVREQLELDDVLHVRLLREGECRGDNECRNEGELVLHPSSGGHYTSFQNCCSLSSVMRCPFSRRRLISISFKPASLPAACNGLGRPLTTTRVSDDGPEWTIAPALRAARIASLRRLRRIPVKARCTPLSVR